MKKGIKFRDSSVLNLILFFFSPLNILKYRDKMKEAKRIYNLAHINVISVQKTQSRNGTH